MSDEKPSISEQYIRATGSSSIVLDPNRKTDADVLLAAGYAASRNESGSLALRFYRMRCTGDMSGFHDLSEICGGWLVGRSMRRGRKPLRRIEAQDLASRVLLWWANPACDPCNGLGHPLMPNSPVINYGHDCPVCQGTGKMPIYKVVPLGTADEARWLVDELDRGAKLIFDDMARLLS